MAAKLLRIRKSSDMRSSSHLAWSNINDNAQMPLKQQNINFV